MTTLIHRPDGTIINGPDDSTSNLTNIPPPVVTSPPQDEALLTGQHILTGTGIAGLEVLYDENYSHPVWRSLGIVGPTGSWSGGFPVGVDDITIRTRHLGTEWGTISEPITYRVSIPSPAREYPTDGSPIHIGHLIKGTAFFDAFLEIEVFSEKNPNIVHKAQHIINDHYGFQLRPEFDLTDNGQTHILRIRQTIRGKTSDWNSSKHTFIL